MPFPPDKLRRFTPSEIDRLPPGQAGVIGIYNAKEWFCIEPCDDIRERMVCLYNDDAALEAFGPTGFFFEPTDLPESRAVALRGDYGVSHPGPARPPKV